MKLQISRLSPHQNAKVFAVMMALTSLIFIVPFFLLFSAFGPTQAGAPMAMVFILPVIYLVFGYIVVSIGCAVYNLVFKLVGGIEFESKVEGA